MFRNYVLLCNYVKSRPNLEITDFQTDPFSHVDDVHIGKLVRKIGTFIFRPRRRDQGAHRGLQEDQSWRANPRPHQRGGGRTCVQLQIPWCSHLRGPLLDPQHLVTGEEGSSASLLPEETEESTPVSSDSDERLPVRHWEHPHQLHHCLVWQLHCI